MAQERRQNIELFMAVRDKIAATPEAYDQAIWGRHEDDAPCGTACCIAGWACVLGGVVSPEEIRDTGASGVIGQIGEGRNVGDLAEVALGLSEQEGNVLFTSMPEGEWDNFDNDGNDIYSGGWPEPFGSQWRNAVGDEERARAAVAYLNHIIETGRVLD